MRDRNNGGGAGENTKRYGGKTIQGQRVLPLVLLNAARNQQLDSRIVDFLGYFFRLTRMLEFLLLAWVTVRGAKRQAKEKV